jgi:hypothetical protein
MEQEINVDAVLKELREIIGNQAQEIAILKSLINTPPSP